jgi:hypothetical protein
MDEAIRSRGFASDSYHYGLTGADLETGRLNVSFYDDFETSAFKRENCRFLEVLILKGESGGPVLKFDSFLEVNPPDILANNDRTSLDAAVEQAKRAVETILREIMDGK